MASIADMLNVLDIILAILLILSLFGLMGLVPLIITRITERFNDFIERKNFYKKLVKALENDMVENLKNIEYIFFASCPVLSSSRKRSFYLKSELSFFLGLLNSKYSGIVFSEVNLEKQPTEKLKKWRTILENIIQENEKKLNYADLPQEDQLIFKQIFDHFDENSDMPKQNQTFIKSRIIEIKQLLLQKNKIIEQTKLINWGALIVSIVSIILTILFGFRIFGS